MKINYPAPPEVKRQVFYRDLKEGDLFKFVGSAPGAVGMKARSGFLWLHLGLWQDGHSNYNPVEVVRIEGELTIK